MIDMINQRPSLDELLRERAGSYLKPVIYESRNDQVCCECGGFKKSQYPLCWSCSRIKNSAQQLCCQHLLADRVACGFYAVEEWDDQAYKVIHDYKEDVPSAAEYKTVVQSILTLHVLGHLPCIVKIAGSPVTAWATIPSTKNSKRYGKEHPLHAMMADLLHFLPEVTLRATNEKNRRLDPGMFTMKPDRTEDELRHVLLIDDSWVTGGTVQSAAVCLKRGGASRVSVYCATRIANASFIASLSPPLLSNFKTKHHYRMGWCPWERATEE